MTKLCICSDSHGSGGMEIIKEQERPQGMLFLGDGERDTARLDISGELLFAAVCGNCDLMAKYPVEQILTIEGKRLLMTHGHRYKVKQGLDLLRYRGQEVEADNILYGHTHRANAQNIDGRLYLNPGAWGDYPRSYLVLLLDGEKVEYIFKRW